MGIDQRRMRNWVLRDGEAGEKGGGRVSNDFEMAKRAILFDHYTIAQSLAGSRSLRER